MICGFSCTCGCSVIKASALQQSKCEAIHQIHDIDAALATQSGVAAAMLKLFSMHITATVQMYKRFAYALQIQCIVLWQGAIIPA